MEATSFFKRYMIIAGLSGAIAVALGAFGAHGLKNELANGMITAEQLNAFDTGVKYQMYHTLALLLTVLLQGKLSEGSLKWMARFFIAGIILFSGSLYFLATRNLLGAPWLRLLGPVTPMGGFCFTIAWIIPVFTLLRKRGA
jgi:uncharacterized membrane protein YgdD (TMEM256/DUF423 family)